MIGLTGVQSLAKDVLEPLGKAQKAPLANLGVLLPFAATMLKERLGMADKPSLAWAPAPLRPAAEMIESATAAFGSAVRDLAIKHRKGILEQQLQVQRVADVVIDITAASAALLRRLPFYAEDLDVDRFADAAAAGASCGPAAAERPIQPPGPRTLFWAFSRAAAASCHPYPIPCSDWRVKAGAPGAASEHPAARILRALQERCMPSARVSQQAPLKPYKEQYRQALEGWARMLEAWQPRSSTSEY